jgi:hypothetical protein
MSSQQGAEPDRSPGGLLRVSSVLALKKEEQNDNEEKSLYQF